MLIHLASAHAAVQPNVGGGDPSKVAHRPCWALQPSQDLASWRGATMCDWFFSFSVVFWEEQRRADGTRGQYSRVVVNRRCKTVLVSSAIVYKVFWVQCNKSSDHFVVVCSSLVPWWTSSEREQSNFCFVFFEKAKGWIFFSLLKGRHRRFDSILNQSGEWIVYM